MNRFKVVSRNGRLLISAPWLKSQQKIRLRPTAETRRSITELLERAFAAGWLEGQQQWLQSIQSTLTVMSSDLVRRLEGGEWRAPFHKKAERMVPLLRKKEKKKKFPAKPERGA